MGAHVHVHACNEDLVMHEAVRKYRHAAISRIEQSGKSKGKGTLYAVQTGTCQYTHINKKETGPGLIALLSIWVAACDHLA